MLASEIKVGTSGLGPICSCGRVPTFRLPPYIYKRDGCQQTAKLHRTPSIGHGRSLWAFVFAYHISIYIYTSCIGDIYIYIYYTLPLYLYIRIYVCVCIYIYIYTHSHTCILRDTHTHTRSESHASLSSTVIPYIPCKPCKKSARAGQTIEDSVRMLDCLLLCANNLVFVGFRTAHRLFNCVDGIPALGIRFVKQLFYG